MKKIFFRKMQILGICIFIVILTFVFYNLLYFEYELVGIQELKEKEKIRFSFTKFRSSRLSLYVQGQSLANRDFLVKYYIRDHVGNFISSGESYDAISVGGFLPSGKYDLEFELIEGTLEYLKNKKIILRFPRIIDPVVLGYGCALYQGKMEGIKTH